MSQVQGKVGRDDDVKGEIGGTDSTEQQRCQLILRQQVRGEHTQHNLDAANTQQELKGDKHGKKRGGHY